MAKNNQKFSGLTDEQVRSLFERIATTINLMAELCREKAEEHGDKEIALTFHALDTMLCGVGALADLPIGDTVVGDFATWMVGPIFHEARSTGGAA